MEDDRIERQDKMEQDFTVTVDAQLPIATELAKQGKLIEALEQLQVLEKQTRTAADLNSTTRILIHSLQLCFDSQDWKTFNEQIVLYSKKRGQLKQAIAKMVQEAMTYIDKTPNMEIKLSLIDTLLQVTEGKIFVEIEGARLTRLLAKIKEDEGNLSEAADILQHLQVETFGSMDRHEKVDFILEQMRLLIAKNDYIRIQLASKKINTRFFEKEEFSELKLRYYKLMIQYSVHEEQYLDVCKHYHEIYNTKSVQESEASWKEALQNMMIYAILTPYNNEQSDLINRISHDKKLEELPVFQSFLKCFLTTELMDWMEVEARFKKDIISVPCVGVKDGSRENQWKIIHDRVIEHNIRVISKYYSRIRISKLASLLGMGEKETEESLCKMVVSKMVYARVDRPAAIVSFHPKKDPNHVLNDWSSSINSLLSLIELSVHLINKEDMIHKITEVK